MYQERPDLGAKRVCQSCGAHFYDLAHVPPVCPKCGAEYVVPVRVSPAPRRSQKWAPSGNGYPDPASAAESAASPDTDERPSDEDDRETGDEPDDDAGDDDRLPAGDEDADE